MSASALRPARRTTSRSARLLTRAGAIGALVSASLALSACAPGVETNFDNGFSVTAAMGEIPLEDDLARFEVQVADIASAAELSHIVRESGDPFSWLPPLIGSSQNGAELAPVYIPLTDALVPQREDNTAFDSLGWDLAKIDRFVSYSALPTSLTVLNGDLPALPDSLIPVTDGVVTDLAGEDFAASLVDAWSTLDNVGRPTRFSEHDESIGFGTSTPLVEQWASGEGKSLLDLASVRAIAEALDAYDVVSAVITQPTSFSGQTLLGPNVTFEEAKKALEEFDALVPPDPYNLVGIGWGVVDGKARWIVTYHFLSEKGAKDGAQVLRAVWEEGATVSTKARFSTMADVQDVFVKDSTVAVILNPQADTNPFDLYKLLQRHEVVFASR